MIKNKVSILMCVYNGESFIDDAIKSVLQQTYKNFELIILDDGSTDNTANIIKKYDNIHYVYQKHSGIIMSRNNLLKYANGEYISWLDADDLYEKTKLSKQVQFLNNNTSCDIIFASYKNFLDDSIKQPSTRQLELLDSDPNLCFPTALFRKKVFDLYGNFDSSYNYGEDTSLLIKLFNNKVNLNNKLNDKLYFRRIHNNNISLYHTKVDRNDYLKKMSNSLRELNRGSKK